MYQLLKLLAIGLLRGLSKLLPYAFKKTLQALGFSILAYPALYGLIELLKMYIYQSLSGLPAEVINMLGLLRIDDAIEVVLAAYTFKYAMTRFNTKKLVMK